MGLLGGHHPFASAETCKAYCRRMEAELDAIAPELSEKSAVRIIQELALADRVVVEEATRVRNTPEYHARVGLPEDLPVIPIQRARRWRRSAQRQGELAR